MAQTFRSCFWGRAARHSFRAWMILFTSCSCAWKQNKIFQARAYIQTGRQKWTEASRDFLGGGCPANSTEITCRLASGRRCETKGFPPTPAGLGVGIWWATFHALPSQMRHCYRLGSANGPGSALHCGWIQLRKHSPALQELTVQQEGQGNTRQTML